MTGQESVVDLFHFGRDGRPGAGREAGQPRDFVIDHGGGHQAETALIGYR